MSAARELEIDGLLASFQMACERVERHGTVSGIGREMAKERAIIRNELRSRLLATEPCESVSAIRPALRCRLSRGHPGAHRFDAGAGWGQ